MDKPGPQNSPHHVVIIGGGFGGLYAARTLNKAPVRVTLVDRRNFHLFQPLLYQVATGILGPGEITAPLRHILRKQKNAAVLLGEVIDFDPANRRVFLADGSLDYDTLIVAPGMKNHYYGNDAWEKVAPGLKSVEDSGLIRQKIFFAFEVAERETDPVKRRAWLTFVIVGSGPTGVELTGMVAEIARETLKEDFRSINPEESEILLVDAADRVLPAFPPELSEHARSTLRDLGVQVRTGVKVTAIDEEGIALEGPNGAERIATHTVLWAAGVAASPLGRMLAERTGAKTDRMGRVIVNTDLTVPGHPEIFVIGDMAHLPGKDGNPLPGLAPVATQQGRYVAGSIGGRLRGEKPAAPFSYFDKGTMAVIGRHEAVVNVGRFRFGGITAWLMWLFIHLILLINFESRLVVLVRWAFSYFTHNRGSRVLLAMGTLRLPITGAESRKQPFEQG
ncbi:MAG: NAD(P)/FAD-dependent oxidoreductase [Syntrophaceae bacterium]